jgi:polyisoprenoid-binding protein YceI
MKAARVALLFLPLCSLARAEPASYQIDPNHTHPLVEVDHFGGLSTWRGLFRSTTGTVTLDREAGTGTFDVRIDTASIDFGHDLLNKVALAPKIGEWNGLDAARYPSADYKGTLDAFIDGAPTVARGELNLHGVARPVTLRILTFKCIPNHPLIKREVCGADAVGHFNRADFGVNAGLQYGFSQDVTLRIQVEAIRRD